MGSHRCFPCNQAETWLSSFSKEDRRSIGGLPSVFFSARYGFARNCFDTASVLVAESHCGGAVEDGGGTSGVILPTFPLMSSLNRHLSLCSNLAAVFGGEHS
jgi:hypothetical protein